MKPFIGQVTLFAGTFEPLGWAFCDGSLVDISRYPELFQVLGTRYGGDGRTTFALPDLRSRIVVGPGEGEGLTPISLGEKGGEETRTLHQENLPVHNHDVRATFNYKNEKGNTTNPANGSFAIADARIYRTDRPNSVAWMNAGTITGTSSMAGSGTSFKKQQPFQVVNFIIAINGEFPFKR